MQSTKETREIARKLNIKFGPRTSEENLQALIQRQPIAYQNDAMAHVSQRKEPEPVHNNTQEEVEAAIAPYAKKEGFKAIFHDDNTWEFSCRGKGESGNMQIPLRVIKMKAEMVSKGANPPKGFKDGKDLVMMV